MFDVHVHAIADRLVGVPRHELISLLGFALDRVYVLRAAFAHSAEQLKQAAAFRGFSKSRRPYAAAQRALLLMAARGDAEAAESARGHHKVERVSSRHGLPQDWVEPELPVLTRTGGDAGEGLRLAAAYAIRELGALRRLAVYEAGVARAHASTASTPKAVDALLASTSDTLTAAAMWHDEPMPAELRSIDLQEAFRACGLPVTLTVSRYAAQRGVTF